MTEYPPWSAETHDKYDSAEDIYDRNRKDIHDEICQDTPVKTEENKCYTDIIDTYNRDRAHINQSLSNRLGLGQSSLPGAQQVTIATKHNDQMTEVPDHLSQLSLGGEMETTDCHRKHRKVYMIPQVDGIVDRTDSLSQTPDSVDLTVSPVKHRNAKVDKGNKTIDTNDKEKD